MFADFRVLPCMCLCYLAQSLDKGVLGTASIMGLQADTGMKGQDYALAVSLIGVTRLTSDHHFLGRPRCCGIPRKSLGSGAPTRQTHGNLYDVLGCGPHHHGCDRKVGCNPRPSLLVSRDLVEAHSQVGYG